MYIYKGRKIFFGDLHNHTGFSDGRLTPHDAFEYAKKAGRLDFLAVTDHAGKLDGDKFAKTQQAAIESTTDTFLAIRGCENGFDESYNNEYGIPVVNGGELVTLGADHTCCESDGLEDFTGQLTNVKTAFAGFAHPQEAGWPTERVWNGYDMAHHRTKEVLNFVRMIEVCNETSAYNQIHEKLYPTALDNGFHVSPLGVSDTHSDNWGSSELDSRTAVIADELTEEAIFHGLRNQRCYATETGNTLFDFSINGVLMGGTVENTTEYCFEISVEEKDIDVNNDRNRNPEDKKIKLVEIISDYGNTVWSGKFDDYEIETRVTLSSTTARYFYVRVKNAVGKRIWSAPIWTGREFDQTTEHQPLEKLDKSNFTAISTIGKDSPDKLFNNNPNDCWRCQASAGEATIDMSKENKICAIGYHRHLIPYEDANEINALLNRYRYSVSVDGKEFSEVAGGVITNYGSEQIERFQTVNARYVKIEALSCVGSDNGFPKSKVTIGEITIYK